MRADRSWRTGGRPEKGQIETGGRQTAKKSEDEEEKDRGIAAVLSFSKNLCYNQDMIFKENNDEIISAFPGILRPYFDGLRVGVFDIETTGLSPECSAFILGGIGRSVSGGFPEGPFRVEQFFAESRHEEEHALERCLAALSGLDAVVTYNGTRFDLPFIRYRAAQYGLDAVYDLPHNLDLYRILNKFSDLRKILPNLKQKTVENFFGLWSDRSDRIDGGESVELYERWEIRREPEVLDKILLHNGDDVLQLARLIPIVRKAEVHRAMANLGFPVGDLSVQSIRIEASGGSSGRVGASSAGGRLIVSGAQRRAPRSYYSYASFERDCDIEFDGGRSGFFVSVPLRREGELLFLDLEHLLPEVSELAESPFYASGFLVVRQGAEYQYAEINQFVRLFLKRILEVL